MSQISRRSESKPGMLSRQMELNMWMVRGKMAQTRTGQYWAELGEDSLAITDFKHGTIKLALEPSHSNRRGVVQAFRRLLRNKITMIQARCKDLNLGFIVNILRG